ncbi:helix-turn-helix domain-containing protein [Streptomyces platensis]|uniref:helix-turn-helix domain-containing protein n=1 Tax=Streptomyces platensis TaxID=58346 RepID=UPI001F3584FF|nr:helix-turn-helix domain-containing protein [Streptomyces platensis]MCF3141696.1 helix-turn-helix domain-containing protein [Streptomyces platensis]
MTGQTRTTRSMLSRGLSILNCFRPGDFELALSELARRADMPKPTAHRLIAELVDAGMLERGERGLRLGLSLFTLGTRVPRQRMLSQLAHPHLKRIHDLTRQSAFLFLPNGLEPVMAGGVLGGRGAEPGACSPAESEAAACAVAKLLRVHRARLVPVGTGRVEWHGPRRAVREPSAEESTRVADQGFAMASCGPETVAIAAPVVDAFDALIAALAVAGAAELTHPVRTAAHLRAAGVMLARALRSASGPLPAR